MIISQKISSYIAETLCEDNIVNKDEKDIYVYCFDYIIELLIFFIIIFISGLITKRIPVSIIFMITAFSIRSFGGGMHASTPGLCSIISFIIFYTILFTAKPLSYTMTWGWCIVHILSIIIILLTAPVDTPKRPMSPEKRKKLKKRCIVVCLFLFTAFIGFYMNKLQLYYGTLAICSTIFSMSILIGHIINKLSINRGGIRWT